MPERKLIRDHLEEKAVIKTRIRFRTAEKGSPVYIVSVQDTLTIFPTYVTMRIAIFFGLEQDGPLKYKPSSLVLGSKLLSSSTRSNYRMHWK
ncbi:hypothetical protein NPIL_3331 [Nephila pilipes]|uniref:Uncharacterized protein n=1 Tax=Nephila pilipes TaxID=299642 RepID=A0A8X6NJC6_NEPPI|nr:hypothetical protein NPIL_3331 [Nephila pilipes]